MFNSTPAQQIAQHNDGLETLKAIVDLVQNPQPLLDAHETARKEATLTQEQQEKYDQALDYIALHEQLSAQMKAREDAVKADEETHVSDVESWKRWRNAEMERLHDEKEENETAQRKNDQRAKELDNLWKDMQAEHSRLMTPIDDERAQNENDRSANEKEAARLAKLAAKLDKKKTKVQAALVDDEDEESAAA